MYKVGRGKCPEVGMGVEWGGTWLRYAQMSALQGSSPIPFIYCRLRTPMHAPMSATRPSPYLVTSNPSPAGPCRAVGREG